MFHVPLNSIFHFFRVIFLRVLFKTSKSREKNDNNFILYHLLHARTCATSINAEKKNFVQQLPKTNAQHKT